MPRRAACTDEEGPNSAAAGPPLTAPQALLLCLSFLHSASPRKRFISYSIVTDIDMPYCIGDAC